jgi:cell division protein ZipA
MDAATLRIILLIVGALFLTGLYFWERRRQDLEDEDDEVTRTRKREPQLGSYDDDDDDDDDSSAQPTARPATDAAEVATPSGVKEPLIIQFFVVSKNVPFDGDEIMLLAERHDLHPGEMDIFHRHPSEGVGETPLFSMANLVKPGTFPFDDMADFQTRGLALFAQLTGDPGDLMVFDEMLQAARGLAEALDGELQQHDGGPLSVEQVQKIRDQVVALVGGG